MIDYIDVNFEWDKNIYEICAHEEIKIHGLILHANNKTIPYKLREEGYHLYTNDVLKVTFPEPEMVAIKQQLDIEYQL